MAAKKVALIMAGGTGGHIFPGLALAESLQAQGWNVQWMGTSDRMEADIVPRHEICIHYIEVKGIRGNGILRKLSMPFMLLKAVSQARRIIKKVQPNIVIGFGGYASGPGGLAAKSLGIPLIIHEQNAVLGMTNHWLSKFAARTLLAFPLTRGNKIPSAEIIGNPVRQQIQDLAKRGKRKIYPDTPVRILVIGGSLGARVFNQNLPEVFAKVAETVKIAVHHQSGKGNEQEVRQKYQSTSQNLSELQVDEFINDMTTALDWADLVVCRAGALTVSELAASGNLGIFVPLPHAVDDHQTANANWLVSKEAGRLVPQTELATRLPSLITELCQTPSKISEMQNNAKQLAYDNTTQRLVELCQELELSH